MNDSVSTVITLLEDRGFKPVCGRAVWRHPSKWRVSVGTLTTRVYLPGVSSITFYTCSPCRIREFIDLHVTQPSESSSK